MAVTYIDDTLTADPYTTLPDLTPRSSMASQIKRQRRIYARAVLKALARTQQGQPTVQVQRVLRQALHPSGRAPPRRTLHQLAADIPAGRPVDLA